MIYTAVDNFYVDEERLENSPSRADGISREVETQLRIYGCELIQEGGILLKLPQAVMATAQVLLHRFYVKESLKKFNIKRVAWACCWLSTKLEESPRRLREVLLTFYRVDLRHEGKRIAPLDVYGKEYATFKSELIEVERRLLRQFGFILHVDHPHKFVLDYSRILKAGTNLKQEAWNLANDSLRTTLCVRFWGETVACGLIFLAARRLKEPLPEDPPWWELFKVKKEDMYAVAREVQALFSMPKVQYISVHRMLQERDNTAMVSPVTEPAGTPLLSDHAASDLDTSQLEARAGPGSATNSMDKSPAGTNTTEMEVDRRGGEDEKEPESGGGLRGKEKRRDDDDEEEDRRRRRYRRREVDDPDSDKEERYEKRDYAADYKRDRRDREDRGRERGRDGRDRSRDRPREKDRRHRDRDKRRT